MVDMYRADRDGLIRLVLAQREQLAAQAAQRVRARRARAAAHAHRHDRARLPHRAVRVRLDPAIPATNNAAERSLRHLLGGGQRDPYGACRQLLADAAAP